MRVPPILLLFPPTQPSPAVSPRRLYRYYCACTCWILLITGTLAQCPGGREYNGNCYLVKSKTSQWSEARALCEEESGSLPVVQDDINQEALKSFMQVEGIASLWLDSREERKDWHWTSNEVTIGPQGCYNDIPWDRDLEFLEIIPDMMPQKCIDKCKDAGNTYAAVQSKTECFCDDTYGTHGLTGGNGQPWCSVTCPGNGSIYCGGWGKNSVYFVDGGYGSWGYRQPNDLDNACAVMDTAGNDRKFADEPCFKKLPFICDIPTSSCIRSDPGYFVQDGHCFYLGASQALTWWKAKSACTDRDGTLLTIGSFNGHEIIKKVLTNQGMDGQFWIGLTRAKWNWTETGEQLDFTAWAERSPSGKSGRCLSITSSSGFLWVDAACSEQLTAVCLLPLLTTTATINNTTTDMPFTQTTTGTIINASPTTTGLSSKTEAASHTIQITTDMTSETTATTQTTTRESSSQFSGASDLTSHIPLTQTTVEIVPSERQTEGGRTDATTAELPEAVTSVLQTESREATTSSKTITDLQKTSLASTDATSMPISKKELTSHGADLSSSIDQTDPYGTDSLPDVTTPYTILNSTFEYAENTQSSSRDYEDLTTVDKGFPVDTSDSSSKALPDASTIASPGTRKSHQTSQAAISTVTTDDTLETVSNAGDTVTSTETQEIITGNSTQEVDFPDTSNNVTSGISDTMTASSTTDSGNDTLLTSDIYAPFTTLPVDVSTLKEVSVETSGTTNDATPPASVTTLAFNTTSASSHSSSTMDPPETTVTTDTTPPTEVITVVTNAPAPTVRPSTATSSTPHNATSMSSSTTMPEKTVTSQATKKTPIILSTLTILGQQDTDSVTSEPEANDTVTRTITGDGNTTETGVNVTVQGYPPKKPGGSGSWSIFEIVLVAGLVSLGLALAISMVVFLSCKKRSGRCRGNSSKPSTAHTAEGTAAGATTMHNVTMNGGHHHGNGVIPNGTAGNKRKSKKTDVYVIDDTSEATDITSLNGTLGRKKHKSKRNGSIPAGVGGSLPRNGSGPSMQWPTLPKYYYGMGGHPAAYSNGCYDNNFEVSELGSSQQSLPANKEVYLATSPMYVKPSDVEQTSSGDQFQKPPPDLPEENGRQWPAPEICFVDANGFYSAAPYYNTYSSGKSSFSPQGQRRDGEDAGPQSQERARLYDRQTPAAKQYPPPNYYERRRTPRGPGSGTAPGQMGSASPSPDIDSSHPSFESEGQKPVYLAARDADVGARNPAMSRTASDAAIYDQSVRGKKPRMPPDGITSVPPATAIRPYPYGSLGHKPRTPVTAIVVPVPPRVPDVVRNDRAPPVPPPRRSSRSDNTAQAEAGIHDPRLHPGQMVALQGNGPLGQESGFYSLSAEEGVTWC